MRRYADSFLKDGRIELDSGGYMALTNMLTHLVEESSKGQSGHDVSDVWPRTWHFGPRSTFGQLSGLKLRRLRPIRKAWPS